jgi:hypothetical protein
VASASSDLGRLLTPSKEIWLLALFGVGGTLIVILLIAALLWR